jgi:hypothetical protein
MTSQILRRLEQLEKLMVTPNNAPVNIIQVVFIDPVDHHVVNEFEIRIPPYAVPQRNGGQS